MRKKITNKQIGEVIGKMAEQLREELEYEFIERKQQMGLAENEVYLTLDKEQRKLFDKFLQKREEFYDIAKEIYKRKF